MFGDSGVSLAFSSSAFPRTTGVEERKQANSDPKRGRRREPRRHEQMAIECEERVKTKRWKQRTIGYDSHLLFISIPFSSHPFSSLRIYDSCRRHRAERREHFSRFCRSGISFALFFFRGLCDVSHVLSLSLSLFRLVLRNTHCWFCSNRGPVIYDGSLSQPVFVSRFRADNARASWDAIWNNCALPYRCVIRRLSSAEKNIACSRRDEIAVSARTVWSLAAEENPHCWRTRYRVWRVCEIICSCVKNISRSISYLPWAQFADENLRMRAFFLRESVFSIGLRNFRISPLSLPLPPTLSLFCNSIAFSIFSYLRALIFV